MGLFVDDIPIPSDRISTFGRAFPPMFDLERVEILRGPQGTLLGEGAEGGAVRFISAQPNLRTLDGFTRAQYALTENGGPSYDFGGAFGGPIVPGSLGFRVSAWSRHEGGFVDRVNPFTGAPVDENANWNRREAFSAALTFAPTERFLITPGFRYQLLDVHDSSAFTTYLSDPGAGILNNGKLLTQPYSDTYHLASLRIEADLGFAQLRAISGYLARWARADNAGNRYPDPPNPLGPEYPVSYADAGLAYLGVDQYVGSQQLIFSGGTRGSRVRWVAGGEYIHAHYLAVQDLVTLALADGLINGRVKSDRGTSEIAGFAQTDIQLRDRLTATLGVRVERASYDSTLDVSDWGPEYRLPVSVSQPGLRHPSRPAFGYRVPAGRGPSVLCLDKRCLPHGRFQRHTGPDMPRGDAGDLRSGYCLEFRSRREEQPGRRSGTDRWQSFPHDMAQSADANSIS